jgi:hypothetical protein
MKNEFIPYEQALALKKLGFDESCLGYYDIEGLKVSYDRYLNSENKNSLFPHPSITNNPKISAPLYQQAFRWFREECGLRYFIEYDNGHYNAVVQSSLVYHCDTHEEAELACLNRLIILITPITNPQTKL